MRRAWCQLRGNPKPQPATNLSQQATITGADLDHRRRTSEYSKLGTERMDWCNFLQVQKYFFAEQPSEQPFAHKKENRLLGRLVKCLFY
jgi:hypothetical protein